MQGFGSGRVGSGPDRGSGRVGSGADPVGSGHMAVPGAVPSKLHKPFITGVQAPR